MLASYESENVDRTIVSFISNLIVKQDGSDSEQPTMQRVAARGPGSTACSRSDNLIVLPLDIGHEPGQHNAYKLD